MPIVDVGSWSTRRTYGLPSSAGAAAAGVRTSSATVGCAVALDVLTTAAAAPVLEGNPYVRRVLQLPTSTIGIARLVRTIERSRYDVIIDGKITRGASFIRSPALTMLARAPYRVGVGGGNHDLAVSYTHLT